MKGAIRRKLITASFGAIAALVCLTTTTYAWFAKNADAWVDEFKVDIRQDEGLTISVDNENFFSDITTEQVTKAVIAKRLGINYSDVTEDLVTQYKDDLTLASVSTNDLQTFTTVDSKSTTEYRNSENKTYYVPRELEANEFGYIAFDLYFKAEVATSDAFSKYRLQFTTSTTTDNERGVSYIKSTEQEQKIYNSLKTFENGAAKDYRSGDTININPANAMRLGVLTEENVSTIYEPNTGYSSYALQGNTNNLYNPSYNPMLTYFNNSHSAKLEPLDDLDVYRNTQKDFDGNISFGTFERSVDQTTNEVTYNRLKVTVFLWLEGYDGDYLPTTKTNKVELFLNFTKVGLEG